MPNKELERQGASDVEADVRALEALDLAGLRQVWRDRWGLEPKLRSVDLLRRIIAWRIQAGMHGGLSAETRSLLKSRSMPRTPPPPAGTRLTREYRGVLHTVEVSDGGVQYAGRSYGSLSEVAREITGTHWNGPRFFGLRPGASR
jgi:hypothetical protein